MEELQFKTEELEKASENLDAAIRNFQNTSDQFLLENANVLKASKKETFFYKELLAFSLSSLIGKKIYWASPNWIKTETHTIKEVRIEEQKNDFFGKEYQGKAVVKIFGENGGYFIAEELGKSIFIVKEDAEKVAGSNYKRK